MNEIKIPEGFAKLDENFYFEGCGLCDARCCDGRQGFSLTPLILDDFESVYRFFPILFGRQNDELRAFMMMNDGTAPCPYCIENRCSIYEERPPACRIYPVTPFYDKLLIDTTCPGVNAHKGERIYHDGTLKLFYHERLDRFEKKLAASQEFLRDLDGEGEFQEIVRLFGIPLYQFTGENKSEWIGMHRKSLLNLAGKKSIKTE